MTERHYWTQILEQAYATCHEMLRLPVVECGEPLVPLASAAGEVGVPLLFANTSIAGRFERIFALRAGLVPKLLRVADAMRGRGWLLKIEDGFRSRSMQQALGLHDTVFDAIVARLLWETGGTAPSPELLYRRSLCLIANIPKIGTHMSGSAVDVSVWHVAADGTLGPEVDRGGAYLEMSARTPMDSHFVSGQQRRRRNEISELMAAEGFVPYPFEFWHYNQGDCMQHYFDGLGEPARYGAVDYDAETGEVRPLADPLTPLNPPEILQQRLALALARLAP